MDVIKAAQIGNCQTFIGVSIENRFVMLKQSVFEDEPFIFIPIIFSLKEVDLAKETKDFQLHVDADFQPAEEFFLVVEVDGKRLELLFSTVQIFSPAIFKVKMAL